MMWFLGANWRVQARSIWCPFLLWATIAAAHAWPAQSRFIFGISTFSYQNELRWEYRWDAAGKVTTHPRQPVPAYSLRCVSMARAARQFSYHARFEPGEPKATLASYRHWVAAVLRRDSREPSHEAAKVVLPGYANLWEFSEEHEKLLKAASGGAWRSYFQRGNWRMVFPFRRAHQERVAHEFLKALKEERLPLVHLVCFPSLALNHTVLVYGVEETEREFEFMTYDPNQAEAPVTLRYDRAARRFTFPRTLYFPGGPVNAYEIYRSWCY